MNIYEKLAKSRVDLQKSAIKKSGKNKFAGFDYFELADFLPTANEIFANNGLCPVFNIIDDKAILNIFNTDNTNEVITFQSAVAKLELKGCNEIQALGGTMTYMRRYLYLNALEIVENDSFDAVTGQKQKEVVKENHTDLADAEQKEKLKNFIGGAEFAKVMNACGGKLTIAKYEELINEQKSV